jgi:CBS domain-containing protein
MTIGHFRHLPVVGDAGLVGIVDITDVCRALLEPVTGLTAHQDWKDSSHAHD